MRHFCRFSNTVLQKSVELYNCSTLRLSCVLCFWSKDRQSSVLPMCTPIDQTCFGRECSCISKGKARTYENTGALCLLPGGISLLSIISVLYLSGLQNSCRASHSAWKSLKRSHFTIILPFEFSLAKFNFFGIQFWKKPSNFWTFVSKASYVNFKLYLNCAKNY